MGKNEITGKIITGMKIASDKKALLLQTSDGDMMVRCDGDCCSDTWIEHIELSALGFPAKVLSVEDIPMPNLGGGSDFDVIQYYGCKITTDRGDIIIDYRNESNGYYGGNLSWPGEEEWYGGGVFGQNESTLDWIDLVNDR